MSNRDEVTVSVTASAWFYPKGLVASEKARADEQFSDAPVSVYAGMGDSDEGFVALVGPVPAVEAAEAAWVPAEGAAQAVLRPDIMEALCWRHLQEAGAIVVDEGGEYVEPRPDLGVLMDDMDNIEKGSRSWWGTNRPPEGGSE